MTSACIHGFAPGTCLICQTLDGSKDAGSKKQRAAASKERSAAVIPAPSPPPPARPTRDRGRSGPRVVPTAAPETSTSAVVKLVVLAVAVIGVVVVAWTVLHLVLAVLHIIELIGVALLAGYLGWLAGVHHGRRSAHKQ
ncbi:MAG TPA: hypothetical protein VHT30_11605 [Acidimicrobiales bacterium]|nr:hypothetical protein [Acidimicrobiales bacterium]